MNDSFVNINKSIIFISTFLLLISANVFSQDTPLDSRKIATIQQYDTWQLLGPEDTRYPTPNLTVIHGTHQTDFQAKAMGIFALVQQGLTPASRLDEANRILRYVINAWPAYGPGDVIGSYGQGWEHRERCMGVRLYYLYKDYMDADIRQDFENRMGWAIADPHNSGSENHKLTINQLIFLAHEATGQTHLSTFGDIKAWMIDKLRYFGNSGFHEWGSVYNGWTLGAILNLADFAQEQEVKKLAEMVIDHTLGCSAAFQIDGYYNSPAVRQYGFWIIAPFTFDGVAEHYYDTEIQTDIIHTLFYGAPPIEYRNDWIEWAVSNYRPPAVFEQMYYNSRNSETYMTSDHRWHMYSYIMDRAAIATHHTLVNNYYAGVNDTHDIIQCIIQSDAGPTNHLVTHAIEPRTSHLLSCAKRRSSSYRSLGYKNVVFVNGGGLSKCVWAGGGGGISGVPIRLFYSKDFTVTLEGGSALLTDGNTYAAWVPTIGNPVHDPESGTFTDPIAHGSWLKSSYMPPDDGDGEAAVVEVGDPESFGTFDDFKNEILTRNSRPLWFDGKVVYMARDGAILEFGLDYASIDGVPVNVGNYPRVDSTLGIWDNVFYVNDQILMFDFNGSQVYGPQERLPSTRYYGLTPVLPQAVIEADVISGQPPLHVHFDGSGSYDLDGTIVSYEWDFDDNGIVDATGVIADHVYDIGSTYTCKLVVTDDDDQTDEETIDIHVVDHLVDDAVVVYHTVPEEMRPGHTQVVILTVENTGTTSWTDIDGYQLGAVNDSDPFASSRYYLNEGEVIGPGQQKTFILLMTAPEISGNYQTDWQMVREPGSWFGDVFSQNIQVADSISVDLGTTDIENGLALVEPADGDTLSVTMGERDCRTNTDAASDFYMYFAVDDSYAYQGSRSDIFISIDYYDLGNTSLWLQYDSSDTAPFPGDVYKSGGSTALTNTYTWMSHTFHVTDAYLGNRQNGGADFRIFGGVGNTFYLDKVKVWSQEPIPDPPVAIIQANPTSGYAPLQVNFNGSGSYDNDGSITLYKWDFQDDGIIDANGIVANHVYDAVDTYTARLIVTDTDGLTDTATIDIVVGFLTPDFDGDGDVDQEDFGHLQLCMTGHGGIQDHPDCLNARLDGDEDVDDIDLVIFQECMSGANIPYDPACMQ